MSIDLSWMKTESRLLLDVPLKPVQGTRFQPTGFPDLGAASYRVPGSGEAVLVESAQSMANRLEATIWDSAKRELISAAQGIPYIVTTAPGHETSSIEESHRLNSGYFPDSLRKSVGDKIQYSRTSPVNVVAFARELLRLDPNCILHGVFLSQLEDGRLRLPRLLSSFVEAKDAALVASGGVKLDRISAKGEAEKGTGHIPFSRTEYSAAEITAFFNLDLHLLRSYGLPEEANRFLVILALYKIRAVLESGLRFRTACDLEVDESKTQGAIRARRPKDWSLPGLEDLAQELAATVAGCKAHFADPAVTRV
ncbi:MAG: type I-U CRISPR-associated protein Cas7 [Candidatus Eremiobacteraeota bacterium]|nr:type I-U CRISPR-associated protein Cas7 [Candidatus Eremiobacteraeota bacterium]MCW5869599.1 type I-U CRISPR-associated protein Cas7 [Candidatus Eremiobacteraeota bacterium]